MATNMNSVNLSSVFLEAFSCRLEHIKSEWSRYSQDLTPDAILQLAVLLSKIEQMIGIEYLQANPPSLPSPPPPPPPPPPLTIGKAVCLVCFRKYSRVNDLNTHIKHKHPYLQPSVEAKACHFCGKEYDSHKKLVLHEKATHKAAYQSRAEFIWPGFTQLYSREAQISFLESLGGDRQDSAVYTFVSEAADRAPACLGSFDAMDEQYFADNQIPLQNDSDFYGNLDSLLFPSPSAIFESSTPFPPDYSLRTSVYSAR